MADKLTRESVLQLTVEEYMEYKKQSLTDAEIAQKLFVSSSTLANWKLKNKIVRKAEFRMNGILHEKTTTSYIELKIKGMRDHEIYAAWGVSRVTLNRWKLSNGLAVPVPLKEKVKTLYKMAGTFNMDADFVHELIQSKIKNQ